MLLSLTQCANIALAGADLQCGVYTVPCYSDDGTERCIPQPAPDMDRLYRFGDIMDTNNMCALLNCLHRKED